MWGEKMQTIYIDVLITVNTFIDFFLILCTKKFLNIRTSLKHLIAGSLLGGVLSLVALFPEIPVILNLLLDLLFAVAIIFVSFGKTSLNNFIRRVTIYFITAFIFCGIMIFIYSTFKPKGMEIYNDVVYFNISPILLIILTLACYYILKLTKRLTKGVCGGGTCNVEIYLNGKYITFCSKIDSGCNLKEPFSGEYVIIVEKALLDDYQPDDSKIRLIPFESLGGKGILRGFKPEKIKINGDYRIDNVYLGICENVITGDVKSLMPLEIIKDIIK